MIAGLPRKVKPDECRVGMIPVGAEDPGLAGGRSVQQGRVANRALAEAFQMEFQPAGLG